MLNYIFTDTLLYFNECFRVFELLLRLSHSTLVWKGITWKANVRCGLAHSLREITRRRRNNNGFKVCHLTLPFMYATTLTPYHLAFCSYLKPGMDFHNRFPVLKARLIFVKESFVNVHFSIQTAISLYQILPPLNVCLSLLLKLHRQWSEVKLLFHLLTSQKRYLKRLPISQLWINRVNGAESLLLSSAFK